MERIGSKIIFLVGNEISKVEGLEGLQELREVVLDRNKIKVTFAESNIKVLAATTVLAVLSFSNCFITVFVVVVAAVVYLRLFICAFCLFLEYFKHIICKSVERDRVAHGRKQVKQDYPVFK